MYQVGFCVHRRSYLIWPPVIVVIVVLVKSVVVAVVVIVVEGRGAWYGKEGARTAIELLRGSMVNRTYATHKILHISLFITNNIWSY